MNAAPDYLDEAKVIKWAWSDRPFGTTGSSEEDKIFGFAICTYNDSSNVYRFSCNKNWEVIQDAQYHNVEEALERLPEQYKNVEIQWFDK